MTRRVRRPTDEQRAQRAEIIRERTARRIMPELSSLSEAIRWVAIDALTLEGQEQQAAVVDLVRLASHRFTGGRPLEGNPGAAKAAWLAEVRNGSPMKVAIHMAMKAGGYKAQSRIYELKKAGNWDADLGTSGNLAGISSGNLRGLAMRVAPSSSQQSSNTTQEEE